MLVSNKYCGDLLNITAHVGESIAYTLGGNACVYKKLVSAGANVGAVPLGG